MSGQSVSGTNINRTFAIVTPSFLPDIRRCELLCESLDRCAPVNARHYLIIDRRDRRAFSYLENERRTIIESEELIGKYFRRVPGNRGLWISFKTIPVRGWIMQQIKKIAVIDCIPEQTVLFCDSDTAFFRRFDLQTLMVAGKIGLLDIEFHNEQTRAWTFAARRVLGIDRDVPAQRSYVGYMVCWNRETVASMRERIEKSTSLPWQIALGRLSTFSEYMLYGVYVREYIGYKSTDHAPSSIPLVKATWELQTAGDTEFLEFFDQCDAQTVGVMIHSKLGIDTHRYSHHLRQKWRGVSQTATPA